MAVGSKIYGKREAILVHSTMHAPHVVNIIHITILHTVVTLLDTHTVVRSIVTLQGVLFPDRCVLPNTLILKNKCNSYNVPFNLDNLVSLPKQNKLSIYFTHHLH